MSIIEHETALPEAPAKPVYPELLEAAEYIRQHGWCQHDYMASDGRVCLYGALRDLPENSPALAEIMRAVDRKPEWWNDAPGRTEQEVIDLLERVGWLG